MPVECVDIARFLELSGNHPVIDVRSPSEYSHAHIPGATNVPLFSDEERSEVGTLYKQRGRSHAVMRGLDFFGPRMRNIVERVNVLFDRRVKAIDDPGMGPVILVHCWRGGMRSAAIAWLLDIYGYTVFTLEGGYKGFRKWVLDCFAKPLPLYIIGGYTGSGKTRILEILRDSGEKVIDLESLASHKGSSFGSLGMANQPSQEMFENLLALQIHYHYAYFGEAYSRTGDAYSATAVWVEDESQRIGRVNIPMAFWNHMRTQPVFFLDLPFELRLDTICADYGKFEKDQLVAAITRISKRLGGLETKTAIGRLIEDDIKGCFEVLLRYYDKTYGKSLQNRTDPKPSIEMISIGDHDVSRNARLLIAVGKKKK